MSLTFNCKYEPVKKLKHAKFTKDVVGLFKAYYQALVDAGKNLSSGEELYYEGIKNELQNIESVVKKLSNGEESFKLAKNGGDLEQFVVKLLLYLTFSSLPYCNY